MCSEFFNLFQVKRYAYLKNDQFLDVLLLELNEIEYKRKNESILNSQFVEHIQNCIVNNHFEKFEIRSPEKEDYLMSYVFNTYLEEVEAKIVMRDNFEMIFNSISYHVIVIDEDKNIRFINSVAKKFYLQPNEADEYKLVEIVNDEFIDFIQQFSLSEIPELTFDFTWKLNNNEKRFLQFRFMRITFEGKNQVLVLGEDVTEKKVNQNKILRATLHGQELERDWISKELHDSLGQNLNAAISHFNASLELDKNTDLFNETVQTSKDLLLDSIDFIRKMAQNLKMADFENTYFVQTVIDFTNKLKNLGPEFIVSANTNSIEFDNKKDELFVFRIIQEFVNNTMKHANATLVYIIFNFKKKTHELDIKILDDGIGFDMEKTSFNNGIHNIKQRLKALNAEYNFKSKVGKGTELKFTLNLSKSKKVSKSKTKTTLNTI